MINAIEIQYRIKKFAARLARCRKQLTHHNQDFINLILKTQLLNLFFLCDR